MSMRIWCSLYKAEDIP